jgi:type VI secretion system secreted protein Hcp
MNVILLDLGGEVRGESSVPGHENKIELLSFSHGVAMQITGDLSGPERTSGRPLHQDMAVTKYLDASTPILNIGCCEGKVFPQVNIIFGSNDGGKVTELLRYTLGDVVISAVSVGGGGPDRPVEALTLNYNKITWKFSAPAAGEQGIIRKTWNLAQNKSE